MINKKYVFLLLICIFSINVYADTIKEKVTFVRCVDGDTAVFNYHEEDVKFRFIAIDTPETVHPTKEVEAYGKDASEYSCNKLTNAKEIVIELEKSNKSDKYGRKLGWIWIDGSLLQEDLIKSGYATVAYIYGNYKYTDSLCLIQKEAINNKYGIWFDGTRDEGYCKNKDLSKVSNNIKYTDTNEIEEDNNTNIENITSEYINKIDQILEDEDSQKIVGYAVAIIVISFVIIKKYIIKK